MKKVMKGIIRENVTSSQYTRSSPQPSSSRVRSTFLLIFFSVCCSIGLSNKNALHHGEQKFSSIVGSRNLLEGRRTGNSRIAVVENIRAHANYHTGRLLPPRQQHSALERRVDRVRKPERQNEFRGPAAPLLHLKPKPPLSQSFLSR